MWAQAPLGGGVGGDWLPKRWRVGRGLSAMRPFSFKNQSKIEHKKERKKDSVLDAKSASKVTQQCLKVD